MEVRPEGQILEPKYKARFYNAIRALVRDHLNPAIPNWKDYLEQQKKDLWEEHLMHNFRFSEGTHELVK
jgi:hypothetical protein